MKTKLLSLALLSTLFSSTVFAESYEDFVKNKNSKIQQEQQEFQKYKADQEREFANYKKALEAEFKEYKKELSKYWDDPEISDKKNWVNYSKDKETRTKVGFESKEITIETIASSPEEAKKKLRRALALTVTADTKQADERDELEQRIKKLSKGKPDFVNKKIKPEPILSTVVFNKPPSKKDVIKYVDTHINMKKVKVEKAKDGVPIKVAKLEKATKKAKKAAALEAKKAQAAKEKAAREAAELQALLKRAAQEEKLAKLAKNKADAEAKKEAARRAKEKAELKAAALRLAKQKAQERIKRAKLAKKKANLKIKELQAKKTKKPKVYKMVVKLPQNMPIKRSKQYVKDVMKHAHRFKLAPSLVFAIMETESSFNPRARSHVPAFGLMQIVPTTAGVDGYNYVYKKKKAPTPEYLYDGKRNIELGSAYLHILYYSYLRKIKDPQSRLYCTMAAYNTGAGNIAWAFTKKFNLNRAAPIINKMSSDEVYKHLRKHLRWPEAQNYLKNVNRRMLKYKKVLNEA